MRILIAGGGLAAQRCAETLRARGHDGPITMLCAEPHAPYDRPPLSKGVLAGDSAPSFRPDGWYGEHGIALRTGSPALRLDSAARRVVTAGESLPYDRLLIATGARPRTLPALEGRANVQVLRTLDDALALRDALRPGTRLSIVGAGLIGQEVAAAARAAGAEATLIDAAREPFGALVGAALAPWLASLQRDAGVRMRLGARLASVEGDEHAEALVLESGERIGCDHVLVGVGVVPETGWLPPDVAALPGVFAAGDAVRPGHWEAAARQGMAAARAMLGLEPAADALPLVWSDQHGVRIQRLGELRGDERAELDGDLAAHDFTVTYHRAGRPVAAVLAGRPGALPAVRRRLSQIERERNAA
jgi:3-phenylpropionate/trans-cinnamate dioxygenase ferredoxin reductase component